MVYISEFLRKGEPPCWPCCNATHDYVVNLARELSKQLIREAKTTKYNVHGKFGIFADGDAIDYNQSGRARQNMEQPWNINYKHTKTRFLFSHLCALTQQRSISTVCEIGFNAGLSAILLLEASRSARVLSYDLADFAWARRADELVRQYYGPTRFPGVAFGNSTAILLEQKRANPAFTCDAAFIDGAKTYRGRLQHLRDIRNVASAGVPVFLDEITAMHCINGSIANRLEHIAACHSLHAGYWESTWAYSVASREGLLRVHECAWPPKLFNVDGICVGELL